MIKQLGKIKNVKFGIGGYQNAMIGIHFTLGGDGWGIGDTWSVWDYEIIKRSEHAKWTEQDRDMNMVDIMRKISKLLKDAKVSSVDELAGIPIEVTLDGDGFGSLKEWRVLTEVL